MSESIRCVALLGKRNYPTDGICDYLAQLGDALKRRDVALDVVDVPWMDRGWVFALWDIYMKARHWRGKWVLLQYTAYSWSRYAVPFELLLAIALLRCRGAKVGIRFHDAGPLVGPRFKHQVRGVIQKYLMRLLYYISDISILNVLPEHSNWLPKVHKRATFIPIGSNINPPDHEHSSKEWSTSNSGRIAVFGVSSATRSQEVADIVHVAKYATQFVQHIELAIIGIGSKEAENDLRDALNGTPIEVKVYGILPTEKVSVLLSNANIHLFVRGGISTQRGSALAGIACGVPIVAYAIEHTNYQIREAGVVLVPYRDQDKLAQAVVEVISDRSLQFELHQRSIAAYRKYFTWDCIAYGYLEALSLKTSDTPTLANARE
jgi:glycosyltransferase involved in cell wall biosynthesis